MHALWKDAVMGDLKLPPRHHVTEDGRLIVTDPSGGIVLEPHEWGIVWGAVVYLNDWAREWVENWDARYAARPDLYVTQPPSSLMTGAGVEPIKVVVESQESDLWAILPSLDLSSLTMPSIAAWPKLPALPSLELVTKSDPRFALSS
jgi:hypothetical protein